MSLNFVEHLQWWCISSLEEVIVFWFLHFFIAEQQIIKIRKHIENGKETLSEQEKFLKRTFLSHNCLCISLFQTFQPDRLLTFYFRFIRLFFSYLWVLRFEVPDSKSGTFYFHLHFILFPLIFVSFCAVSQIFWKVFQTSSDFRKQIFVLVGGGRVFLLFLKPIKLNLSEKTSWKCVIFSYAVYPSEGGCLSYSFKKCSRNMCPFSSPFAAKSVVFQEIPSAQTHAHIIVSIVFCQL